MVFNESCMLPLRNTTRHSVKGVSSHPVAQGLIRGQEGCLTSAVPAIQMYKTKNKKAPSTKFSLEK